MRPNGSRSSARRKSLLPIREPAQIAPLAMIGPDGAACGTPVADSNDTARTEPATKAARISSGTVTVYDLLVETRPSERGALPAGISQSSVTRPCESGAEGTGTMSTVPRELSTEASQPGVPSSWAIGVTGFAPGPGGAGGGCRTIGGVCDVGARAICSVHTIAATATTVDRTVAARQNPRLCQKPDGARAPSFHPRPAQMRVQTCSGASTGSMSASHGPRRRSHSATRSANAGSLATRACTVRC